MDFSPENPVQLVVKAPNQRIADQTVECMLDWTVKKLKQHLENVYPSKPCKDQQKLIYSGKLLSDHLTLKEILRQFDSEVNHTVHLVCSPGASSESHQPPLTTRNSSKETVSPTHTSDGLRYRGHTTESSQNSFSPTTTAQQSTFPQMQFPTMPPSSMPPIPPMMQPPSQNMYNYTPEQYMWMQQMYMQQYYAYYMQYYQTGATPTPTVPTNDEITVPPNVQNPENVGAANQQRNVDQPIRMNAQGGPVMDDDDEIGQWDWLDWVYALCRFMVLISIVYFYSTLNRFMLVILFSVIVYLLRVEWIRERLPDRRAARNNQEAAQPPPQEPQQQEQEQPQQQSENDSQNNGSEETGVNSETSTEETTTEEPQQPPEPPRPSTLSIAWTFVSTFFTSLIPQPPPAVNAN